MAGFRGSTRSARLPADWPARRRAALARCGHRCEWARILRRLPDLAARWRTLHPGQGTCRARAEQVDHIRRGDDHAPTNLAGICPRHHGFKTGWEGGTARRPAPGERHPGIIPRRPGG